MHGLPAFLLTYVFLYARIGILFPYLSLYFREQGCSVAEVNRLSFFISLSAILMQQVWGYLADVRLTRRWVLMLLLPAASAVVAAMTFVVEAPPSSERMLMMIGLGVLLGATNSPIAQLLNGLTLGDAQASGHFSLLRAVGSGAFIVANLAMGFATSLTSLSLEIVWPLYAVFAAVTLVGVLLIPDRQERGPGRGALSFRKVQGVLLGNPSISGVLVLIVIYETAFAMAFYVIQPFFITETLGLDNRWVSLCYVVAAISEIPFLLFGDAIIRRIGAQRCLFIAAVANVVRWLLAFHLTGPWSMVALSVLHSVSFGVFYFGAIRYVDRHSDARLKASAQTLIGICYFGLAHMSATLVSSLLLDYAGLTLRDIFLVAATLSGVALLYQVWFWGGEKRRAAAPHHPAPLIPTMEVPIPGTPSAAPLATSVGPASSAALGTPAVAVPESSSFDDDAADD